MNEHEPQLYTTLSQTEAAYHIYTEVFPSIEVEIVGNKETVIFCFEINEALAKSRIAFRDPKTVVNLAEYLNALSAAKRMLFTALRTARARPKEAK